MSVARPSWFPDRSTVAGELGRAALVAATLAVVGESVRFAAVVGLSFLALQLLAGVAEAAVGDYADNVLFGLFVLAATAYAGTLTTPVWIPLAGVALGGWFLLDGVQHLRHGVSRGAVHTPSRHEGGLAAGLLRALVARLLEPIRL
ncbi:hypothetical protein [Haloarcula halophila]|uniref:hypothetical protein n=1 Tax=Haloarcula TaxID=2237 RepID=UPI0023E3B028|nr:hypothetical protein [Halomicroarcula sp. DFY41]